jgi:maleate isomerase
VTNRKLLGVLTPSSNTRLEPLTAEMLRGLAEVSAHFSRFRVVDVSLAPTALAQFDNEVILTAADLLADARVDAIVWSGTSAGWLGLEADHVLCAQITARTGIAATTSTLAVLEAFRLLGASTIGLVSPYPAPMQDAIVANLALEGFQARAARPLGITSNWALSEVTEQTLDEQVAEVAARGVQAVTTFCTNLPAASLVPGWERNFNVPVIDTVSAAVWGALRLAGVDPARVTGWGSLFSVDAR